MVAGEAASGNSGGAEKLFPLTHDSALLAGARERWRTLNKPLASLRPEKL